MRLLILTAVFFLLSPMGFSKQSERYIAGQLAVKNPGSYIVRVITLSPNGVPTLASVGSYGEFIAVIPNSINETIALDLVERESSQTAGIFVFKDIDGKLSTSTVLNKNLSLGQLTLDNGQVVVE